MLKVGLTGSIAVGKSFVAEVLTELGCPVLDSDITAREVVEPGTSGWQKIVKAFGNGVLNSDETLNRGNLGAIVFADEQKRLLLNSIVHPLVFAAQDEWLNSQENTGGKIAVIDAALMIESGGWQRFDKIVVVWCQPEVQLERLMIRNNLGYDEALLRINAQMPQAEKKLYADFLIDSSLGFEDTRRQVLKTYQTLKKIADS
ncbi:MAG: dephospho-CoA kinase [Pyrinomonadaceae bacterium]